MTKGMKTLILKVPNKELYRIVKNLGDRIAPHCQRSSMELVRYSPDEVCEDVEDVRLVTRGTKDHIKTTHVYSPRADGNTEVMIELEASLLRGGGTSVNMNLTLWTIAYMAIESAYLEARCLELCQAQDGPVPT